MSLTVPTRALGDLQVSAVGLGCNNFGGRVDVAGTRAVVDAALEHGVTFFDTADIYGGQGGSERLLGEALRGRRDQVVLATKFGMDMGRAPGYPDAPRGSREYIHVAIQQSLKRLGTDHVELYQYHQPDGVTPIAETLSALHELVQAGTVRCLGASNFSADQIEEAAAVAQRNGLTPFLSVQNQYSLLERDLEQDVMPVCERLGIAILPFFPLASGLLTGKYRRGEDAPEGTRLHGRGNVADETTFDQLEQLARFAEERGLEVVEVAIGALAAQPMVASVIAGATKPEQVQANVRAVRWTPSPEDLAELDAIFPSPRR
ncbi:MAG: aldo/keto reductase [Actinomycetota bacterium]|nr:aldo/keto reductase [Actinomycetota bacterium]